MTPAALELIAAHPSKSWARQYLRRNVQAFWWKEPPLSVPLSFDSQPIRKPPQFYRGARVTANKSRDDVFT